MDSDSILVLPTIPTANPDTCHGNPPNQWPGMHFTPVTNALWRAKSNAFHKLMAPAHDGPSQQLLSKTPGESRLSLLYDFSNDYTLRDQYQDPWNQIRIDMLLDDMDALAGFISGTHSSDGDSSTRPLMLVLASADKIVLKKPISMQSNLKMGGAVTWVGRSSLEIQIRATQPAEEGVEDESACVVLTANFTFAARDSKTGKSAPVHRLVPQSDDEKLLFAQGEARDARRKKERQRRQQEILNGEKTQVSSERLQSLLTEGRALCGLAASEDRDSILIRDTRLENSLICQPQQRNLHGRVFAGFLMGRAYELAFNTCYAFVGHRPCFVEVGHIEYLKPVEVGDFLRFKSCVLHTQFDDPKPPVIHIEVVAHVTRPELKISEVSNTYYFIFTVHSGALEGGIKIKKVLPATEEEALHVLEHCPPETAE
eukprot:Gb_20781 [translate_table: standard]